MDNQLWSQVLATMPGQPPIEEGGYFNPSAAPGYTGKPVNVPGVGAVTWLWNGGGWEPDILDPTSRTMQVLSSTSDGGITARTVPYGDGSFMGAVKDLLPVAAVALGGPMLGGSLQGLSAASAASSGYAEGWSGAAGAGVDPSISSWGSGILTSPEVSSTVQQATGTPLVSTTGSTVNPSLFGPSSATGQTNPLPYDSIQQSIDSISGIGTGPNLGQGVNDLANIGSATVGPMAGLSPSLAGLTDLPQGVSDALVKAAQTGGIPPTSFSSSGGLLDTLSKVLGGGGTNGKGLNNTLSGLLGAYTNNQNAGKLADALKAAADKADPFSAQRAQYQDQFKSMATNPDLFKTDAGTKLNSMINDPNTMTNPYGTKLQGMIADPNTFKNPYGDQLTSAIQDPNYFNNPFGTRLQQMINDPSTFQNKYGTEAGKMMQDPSYFINNPMMKSLRDNALNSTQARLAAQLGGDQGSLSARDALDQSVLAAQAPSLQNYFNSLVNGDTNTNQNTNSFLSMLSGANSNSNTTKGNFLNTLSGANQYTLQNVLDQMKSLGTMDIGTNANTTNYMQNLNSTNANQNNNTMSFMNAIGNAAGANTNPYGAGLLSSKAADSNYNATANVNGDIGKTLDTIPNFLSGLNNLFGSSNGTSTGTSSAPVGGITDYLKSLF